MADWDGRGLPPAARARMERFRTAGVATSLLGAPDAAALREVGMSAVGEVMGCIVEHIGWQGWGGCGYYATGFGGANVLAGPTLTSGQAGGFGGYKPYVDALYRGYDTALARLRAEAQEMGADGVVGVTVRVSGLGEGNREFVAMGTAVRAASQARPRVPFTTTLTGPDVAKLVHSGWVPVAVAYGISVGVRHDDYVTRRQAMSFGQNTEVSGYTELVHHTRADARDRFRQHAARDGGDAAVVASMGLHIWEIEPGEGHRDHVAEATVSGDALARYQHGAVHPRARTVLPLREKRRTP